MAINMKRSIWIFIIAVLFVSLVSCDKEEEKQDPNSVPVYVRMCFTYYATESMIEYCDIIVKHNDGTNEKTDTIKAHEWKESDDLTSILEWSDTIEATLPAVLSFTRIIKLRDSSTTPTWTSNYSYKSVALNANKDTLPISYSQDTYSNIFDYDAISNNGLDIDTHVFYFNKDGYLTDAEGNLRK